VARWTPKKLALALTTSLNPGSASARTDSSDTALSLISMLMDFSSSWAVSVIPLAAVAPRFAATWPRTAAAPGGSPPGATNSTGRASKRRVASTPIMEEQRTELCQLERTLGIRMERIQAIAICKRRVGFGVALIACHRLPRAEWFSSQENSCQRRWGADVSPNIERFENSPLDRLGRSFENISSRREPLA
jgi:hypothetical protein